MQRPSSFDEVVLSQLPRIRAIGRGMLPRSVDLDDFVQDVVVRVYLKREQLRDESRLPQWIASVASNAARTSRRARPQLPASVLPPVASADPTPAQQMESEERLRQVVKALQGLAAADRELLVAHYFDEQSAEDTRRRFGYSYTGFTTRLSRARRRLRKRLATAIGLAAAAMTGVSRRVEAFAGAPVSAGAAGAVAAHALLAGVVWLMVAQGRPVGVDAPVRPAAVSLVSREAAAPAATAKVAGPDGSDRHGTGDAGYARLIAGQYLGASSDLFDYVGEEGLTVEAWLYLNEQPAPRERWPLFWKEGSYRVEYWGDNRYPHIHRRLGGQEGIWDHEPSMVYGVAGTDPSGPRGGPLPLRRWVHMGYQHAYGDAASRLTGTSTGRGDDYTMAWAEGLIRDGKWHILSFMGEADSLGGESRAQMNARRADADTPLVIGAAPLALPTSASPPKNRPITPMRGRVGEVRVSSKARYGMSNDAPEDASAVVPGRFDVDEYTVALWHFDEGPGAPEYADASGNGHTLYLKTSRE